MITLKEQSGRIPVLRFLVGEKRARASQIPVYANDSGQKVVAHKESFGEKVTVWHVLGFGRTPERAKSMARDTVGPEFFCVDDLG